MLVPTPLKFLNQLFMPRYDGVYLYLTKSYIAIQTGSTKDGPYEHM